MPNGGPAPGADGIRCPRCAWSYSAGPYWICAPDGCGTGFDTFATGGRCPACEAQFAHTWCPACDRASPHRAWYGEHGGDAPSGPHLRLI